VAPSRTQPFTNIDFWVQCLAQIYAQNNQAAGRVKLVLNLQCYAGGSREGKQPSGTGVAAIQGPVNLRSAIDDPAAFSACPGFWEPERHLPTPQCISLPRSRNPLSPATWETTFGRPSPKNPTRESGGGFIWNSAQVFTCGSFRQLQWGGQSTVKGLRAGHYQRP